MTQKLISQEFSLGNVFDGGSKGLSDPAKSKRGREEGDGTENVINCRDVCRKLS